MRVWPPAAGLAFLCWAGLVRGQISEEDCQDPANAIIEENCKVGNDSTEWDVNSDGDPSIQGFSKPFSVNNGEKIYFKIKTDSADYRIDIFRVGWYGGRGARQVATVLPYEDLKLPHEQADCIRDSDTLIYDCDTWDTSAEWSVPASAVSGVYLARLVRHDGERSWRSDNSQYPADARFSFPDDKPGEVPTKPKPWPHAYGAQGHGKLANALKEPQASLIYFVVRNDASKSEVLFQTSDTTWQAYNLYGGANVYYGVLIPPFRRAYKVSYNRPFQTRATRAVNILFGAEYPMIRWLESNGYDVSYQAGIDTDKNEVSDLTKHKLFLSVGHDEYWSGKQRENIENARDNGMSLAFFSGNEVFWRIRWENDHRHLVVYKESQEKAKKDPNLSEWTGTWRDGRPFNPIGAKPENSLTGTIFTVNAWRHDALEIPFQYSKLHFWRHTSIAKLEKDDKRVLKPGLLGHEWDEDLDNGHRPPGLVRLSQTTVNNLWMIQDYIANCDSGTATHHLVIYRSKSGSLVFGAGTVQWSWGLDPYHDTETGVPPERANPTNIRVGVDQMGAEKDIQQCTLNLFIDMGVNPGVKHLSSGLVWSEPSADVTPPTVLISEVAKTRPYHLHGTASDIGGRVAAVEFTLDGGLVWHPADFSEESVNRFAWRIDFPKVGPVEDMDTIEDLGYVLKTGATTVGVRAVDDSYNIGTLVETLILV